MNPETQASFMKWRYFRQGLFFGMVRLSALMITLALLGIIVFLFFNGIFIYSSYADMPFAHNAIAMASLRCW